MVAKGKYFTVFSRKYLGKYNTLLSIKYKVWILETSIFIYLQTENTKARNKYFSVFLSREYTYQRCTF